MNLHSAIIDNYKNITHAEFEAKGNHIILKGVNGSGKSSILETLNIIFRGKEAVPDCPIQIGKESSVITWNIGNGEEIQFTITITLSGEDYKIKLQEYKNGQKVTIASPNKFLKSLFIDTALDPQSFFSKSDKEQVFTLYEIMPELKDEVNKIDSAYKAKQEARSIVNNRINNLQVDYDRLQYTPDLPEEEINTADLLGELQYAENHNKQKEILLQEVQNLENDSLIVKSKRTELSAQLSYYEKQLAEIKQKIEEVTCQIEEKNNFLSELFNGISTKRIEIDQFNELSTSHIYHKISESSEINKKIAINKQKKELEEKINFEKNLFSEGLRKMRQLESDRLDLFKRAEMPIRGLQIQEGRLMYTLPDTECTVPLKSLSTGQQWGIVIPLLSSFLPKNDTGMRTMIIKNLNDLDKFNQQCLFEEAKKAGVQLVMHMTIFESDSDQCEIIIKD